jgi:hypothetical protein
MPLLQQCRLFLHEHHPLARMLANADNYADEHGAEPVALNIAPSTPIFSDMEVALIYPSSELGPPLRHAIPLPLRSDPESEYKNTFIAAYSALYDVMIYPLLHLFGRGGFNMPATASRVARQFTAEGRAAFVAAAASRISYPSGARAGQKPFTLFEWVKANIFQNVRLHLLGRLAQEWVLDQFARWQHDYLEGLRSPAIQSQLRGYRAPASALNEGSAAVANERQRIYLPSKIPGSKKDLDSKIADGLAVVNTFGKPTFFITFTANPNWPEMQELMLCNQNRADRADAVTRIFKIKLGAFVSDLYSGRAFGNKAVFVFGVIEFQKCVRFNTHPRLYSTLTLSLSLSFSCRRGLPHAHIACRIAYDRQPTSAAEIDLHISAEIPNCDGCTSGLSDEECPCADHRLRRIITKSMSHRCVKGRCWPAGTLPANEVCKYGYPFAVHPATGVDDNGRVRYMRRSDADCRVVPYNRFLCLKYEAHINVEIAHTTLWVPLLARLKSGFASTASIPSPFYSRTPSLADSSSTFISICARALTASKSNATILTCNMTRSKASSTSDTCQPLRPSLA